MPIIQAIYNFRGCLTDGITDIIDVIAQKFNCDKMPLTTNCKHSAISSQLLAL